MFDWASTPKRVASPTILAVALLAGASAPQAGGAEGKTVTDPNGNSVTLARAAERVAALPPPLGTFVVSVAGGPERIVTVHPWSKAAMLRGTLVEYFPKLRDLNAGAVGQDFMPNIEELVRLAPDLVFQVGSFAGAQTDLVRAAGLPLLTINITAGDDAVAWLPMLGAALGAETSARDILAWRMSVRSAIEAVTRDLPQKARPTVIHVSLFGSALAVVGGAHIRSWQIGLAGGVNLAAGFRQVNVQIDPEQLLAWDPDVILLNAFDDELRPSRFYEDPRFAGLSAVINRRVYAWPIGGDRWEAPTQESPLGWMWLSRLLQPQLFDWSMPDEIARGHTLLYGHAPSPARTWEILRMRENAGSKDYERLFAR